MSIVNTLKIKNTSYDIAPSKNATLNFKSEDVTDSEITDISEYKTVGKLSNTDPFNNIFTKISQMFYNIRYLNKQLSNIDPTNFVKYTDISNIQTDDPNKVPSSSLVNGMNTTLTSLDNTVSSMANIKLHIENVKSVTGFTISKSICPWILFASIHAYSEQPLNITVSGDETKWYISFRYFLSTTFRPYQYSGDVYIGYIDT